MAANRALTERQRRFVEAYRANANGTQAAIKAGYANPEVTASKLLRNPKVAAVIAEAAAKRTSKAIMNATERQEFWSKVANGKVKPCTMADRLRASELLAKASGDFLERHEIVSGSLIDVLVYVPSNARG